MSLSHGWFFQNHPDPRGRKLDLIRNVFAPRLRERYPYTSIVVFFDFLATPQRPRTEDEEETISNRNGENELGVRLRGRDSVS